MTPAGRAVLLGTAKGQNSGSGGGFSSVPTVLAVASIFRLSRGEQALFGAVTVSFHYEHWIARIRLFLPRLFLSSSCIFLPAVIRGIG